MTVSLVVGFRGDSLVRSFRLAILLSRQFSRVLKPWWEEAEGARGRGGGERAREMISFGSDRTMFYFLRNVRRCFPFLWNGSHDRPFVPNKLRRFLFKGTETFKNPMKKLCSKQGLILLYGRLSGGTTRLTVSVKGCTCQDSRGLDWKQ
jgi:hypothetical protein